MWKPSIHLLLLLMLCGAAQVSSPSWAARKFELPPDTPSTLSSVTFEVLAALDEQVKSEPQRAVEKIDLILDRDSASLSFVQEIKLLAYKSAAHSRLGNFRQALEISETALARATAAAGVIGNRDIAYLYNNIGRSQEGLGMTPEAMKSYMQAHDFYQVEDDQQGMASSNLNIAGLFVAARLFDKAIAEYEEALFLLDPEQDTFLYTRTLNNLAFTHIENGTAEKAIELLAQAEDLSRAMNNELSLAYAIENSGEAYYHIGDYGKARDFLLRAREKADAQGLDLLATGIYHYLGLVEFSENNMTKAEAYAEKALALARKNDDAIGLSKIYDLMSRLAHHREDYKAALEYHHQSMEYEDRMTSENIVTALSLLQTEFQLKAKQQQISLLRRDNEIQQLSLNRDTTLRYIGAGILIILCFSVGILLYVLRLRSRATREVLAREKDLMESKLAAEDANRAKSEFLSYMSHELRTPLNAVIGFSETLRMKVFGELNDKQTEYVSHIHEGGNLLLKLINDLLHLSKIETGAIDLDLQRYSLGDVVEDVIPLVEHLLGKNDVTLHEAPLPENIKPVMIDKIRMEQVLVNLMSNAIKYGRRGGNIWLSITKPTAHIQRLELRDDGIGIAREQYENIFTPFNRAGMEQSGIEGTGAGLSIAKSLVENMGGAIGFESVLGEGTTFWIDLPETAA